MVFVWRSPRMVGDGDRGCKRQGGLKMNEKRSEPALTKVQSELIAYLFDAGDNPIAAPMISWVTASPRYAAFAEKYKDKIRKKLRVTREAGAVEDLLYELEIPFWLLQERRFEVAYEPFLAGKTRGPDFAVTFRTNFTFNLEVTHRHSLHPASAEETQAGTGIDFRLVDVICGKLRQMRPTIANLLLVASSAHLTALDLPTHFAWIKDKAERGDAGFYARQGFQNPADFFKHYERLSGLAIVTFSTAPQIDLWLNPQARVRIPAAVKSSLLNGLKAM